MVKLEYRYFNKLWREWRWETEEHETAEAAEKELEAVAEYNRVSEAKIDGKPVEWI